jgi:glycosyltransferase involved in cell wall biosynthesis
VSKLISVIIPTYNWSEAIRISIASVLAQSYGHFELLVIGDCCTDGSEDLVTGMLDDRISWHNLAVRAGGQSGPNNYGLSAARGELIAYLGHDDVWHRDHLRSLVDTIEQSGADLACSVSIMYGPLGSGIRGLAGIFIEGVYRDTDFFPPSSMMHRRSLTDRIGPWRTPHELVDPVDADFVRRAFSAGASIVSTERLTVFKFNSAWRRDSYRDRDVSEQREIFTRLAADSARCVEEEWVALTRAMREKRLFELFMPHDPGAAPGQYYRANLLSRGFESTELSFLSERRRFLPDDQATAMDWHALETNPTWGSFRWSGPSPVCTWLLPVITPPRFRVRIQLLNMLQVNIADEVELIVGGRSVEFSIRGDGNPVQVLESTLSMTGSSDGSLRVKIRVLKLRCPYFLSNGANPDQRWLGVCFNWLELEPIGDES